MAAQDIGPRSGAAVTGGPDEGRPAADEGTSDRAARPVSRKSEAIIREVSVRRRTAMKVLADR